MENKKWVAGWGCCEDVTAQMIADYIEDITFRYVIYSTLDASALKLHFSNLQGTEAIKVDKVFVARREAPARCFLTAIPVLRSRPEPGSSATLWNSP